MRPLEVLRVPRFLHAFARHPIGRIEEREVPLEVGGVEVMASYIRPRASAPLPGWIVLHGITVPGRRHPVLTRFAYALAASGAAVLIPEVPPWTRLRIDPPAGDAAIVAAAAFLGRRPDVESPRLNLVGFSFGATQALMSAAKPEVRDTVRAVIGFGAYCDLGRTLHFMMTGEHEWKGVTRRLVPDPYGRWIVAANYLTDVPELAHMEALQSEVRELAVESGKLGVYAAEQLYDPLKAARRARLPREQREIWDLLAPPFGVRPPLEPARDLAARLLEAAYRRNPDLDPRPLLPQLDQRIVLAHGKDDGLIPFTETLRLGELLPATAQTTLTITRLFSHSKEAGRLELLRYPREVARYVTLLNRALRPC